MLQQLKGIALMSNVLFLQQVSVTLMSALAGMPGVSLLTPSAVSSQTASAPDDTDIPDVRLNWHCSGNCLGLVVASTAGSGTVEGHLFIDPLY
jgi:hypothetical protein